MRNALSKKNVKIYTTYFVLIILCGFAGTLSAQTTHPNLDVQVIRTHNATHSWITILLLLTLLLNWLSWQNNPLFIRNKTQLVVHNKERGSFYSATMSSQIISYILYFSAYLLSFSIFIYQCIHFYYEQEGFWIVSIIFAIILAYHALKYLVYQTFIKRLFLPKDFHGSILQSYIFINIILGLFLLIINVVLAYVNNEFVLQNAIIIGFFFILLYLVIVSIRLFYIFLIDLTSLFYLILYLCTLEILPLWVSFQSGIKLLLLNE